MPRPIKQLFLLCCLLYSNISLSAPQNGFGAYLGFVGATENSVTSGGLSFGGDAQFAINEKWSLNPMLLTSIEKASNSNTVYDFLIGSQFRYWQNEWFSGVQIFEHARLIYGNGRTKSSSYGVSGGALAGFENDDGKGVELQFEVEPNYSVNQNTSFYRYAVRLNLTYRWY